MVGSEENRFSLLAAKGEAVATDGYLDGVTHRRETNKFHLCTPGQSHFQETLGDSECRSVNPFDDPPVSGLQGCQ